MKQLFTITFYVITLSAFSQNLVCENDSAFLPKKPILKTIEIFFNCPLMNDVPKKDPIAPVDMFIRHYFGISYWD